MLVVRLSFYSELHTIGGLGFDFEICCISVLAASYKPWSDLVTNQRRCGRNLCPRALPQYQYLRMQEHIEALTSLAGLAMSENGTGAMVERRG